MHLSKIVPRPMRDWSDGAAGRRTSRGSGATAAEIEQLLAALGSDPSKHAFQRTYEELRRECGCSMGGAMCVTGTVIYLAAVAFGVFPLDSILRIAGVAALTPVVIILAAAAGKLLGIALARYRLRVLRNQLTTYSKDE